MCPKYVKLSLLLNLCNLFEEIKGNGYDCINSENSNPTGQENRYSRIKFSIHIAFRHHWKTSHHKIAKLKSISNIYINYEDDKNGGGQFLSNSNTYVLWVKKFELRLHHSTKMKWFAVSWENSIDHLFMYVWMKDDWIKSKMKFCVRSMFLFCVSEK